jgi:AcrR family transcriptional regulator
VEQAVLESTLADLAAHGLEGLNVDRIAQRAEVNKTSIYRRWSTREALIAAALEKVRDDLTFKLEDRGSLRADLLELVRSVAQLIHHPMGRALAHAALGSSRSPRFAQTAARPLEGPAAKQARALFDRARARGEWSKSVAPEPVLSMLVGAVLHRILLEQAETDDAWLTSVVDVVVAGVGPSRRGTRGPRLRPF